jgi:hypothetical protein
LFNRVESRPIDFQLDTDYLELEQAEGFQAVELNMVWYTNQEAPQEIFGYVRYILPNSDATDKDIQRGTIFPELMEPNVSNYQSLLSLDGYTLNLLL